MHLEQREQIRRRRDSGVPSCIILGLSCRLYTPGINWSFKIQRTSYHMTYKWVRLDSLLKV